MNQYTLTERRNKIIEILNKHGRVTVSELSDVFGVSNVVIRTDLAELERQDMLSRVHGGAVTSYKAYYDMSLVQRAGTNSSEKTDIATKINELVRDNSTIIMNAGTTPIYAMRALSEKKLTIVTNSIALAVEGAKNPNFKIILIGGDVDSDYQFTYGVSAINELSKYHAETLILSVDGIDIINGISTFYYQEAEICRQMLKSANNTIIAADYSKIGRTAFSVINTLDAVDTIVTNSKASATYLRKLEAKGIEILTC